MINGLHHGTAIRLATFRCINGANLSFQCHYTHSRTFLTVHVLLAKLMAMVLFSYSASFVTLLAKCLLQHDPAARENRDIVIITVRLDFTRTRRRQIF